MLLKDTVVKTETLGFIKKVGRPGGEINAKKRGIFWLDSLR